MRITKIILLIFLSSLFAVPGMSAADEELQIAILTQEMILDITEHGLDVLGKYADAKNIAMLKKVSNTGGQMADVARRSLKIINAYQDGVRGKELKALVISELGDYAYGKLKSEVMNYIKSHVRTFGELSAAYDCLGTLYDSSYYIVYIGMSIGLDMLEPETANKLANSGFTRAVEKIDDLRRRLMEDAAAGADEITEWFLTETEGSVLDKFASSVTDATEDILDMALEGAFDIYDRIFHRGDDQSRPPKDDNVTLVDDSNTPEGDSVVNGGGGEESDFSPSDNSGPPGDGSVVSGDSSPEGDQVQYPAEDAETWYSDVGSGGLPELGEVVNEFADQAAIVGPNFPYFRVLWFFSGESQADSVLGVISNLFSSENKIILEELERAFKTIVGKGN